MQKLCQKIVVILPFEKFICNIFKLILIFMRDSKERERDKEIILNIILIIE